MRRIVGFQSHPLIELTGKECPYPPFSVLEDLGGLMSTRLHVGNIPSTTVEKDLRATFGRFGLVEAVEIAKDSSTGHSKGFAIVAMSRDADAVSAIRGLNFSQYAGRTIGVGKARANQV